MKNEWEKKLEYHYFNDKGINQNYRSRKNIIVFNNQFYSSLRHKLSDNLSKIYNDCSQKMDFVKDGGYVHVELLKIMVMDLKRMY